MVYFSLNELKCKCGECPSTGEEMDHYFMEAIETIREKCGFPFIVTSAFRCPVYNAKVSSGTYGAHVLGKALDIRVRGSQAFEVLRQAYLMPGRITGIGVAQKGMNRFIHLDNVTGDIKIARPMIWSY